MKMTIEDILALIANDMWMMRVLRLVQSLNLPNWWIGAGFVRNKVWDSLHSYTARTPLNDIDVIFFDAGQLDKSVETALEKKLTTQMPGTLWSVTNQARMTRDRDGERYRSLKEALSEWPETATAVAVNLDDYDHVQLNAPLGIDDLVNLRVCPTTSFMKQREKYEERQARKNWAVKWPKLTFFQFPS